MTLDPCLVEIRGTGFSNVGAQLMLAAVMERLGKNNRMRFAVRPHIGPYDRRARYGLYQVFDVKRAGRLGRLIGLLMHGGYRRRYGLVSEKEIGVVLDASGYAIGDAWNPALVEGAAASFRRWRKEGKVVVLLPQAFGPFQEPRVKKAAREALLSSTLVFARDEASFGHISELVGEVVVMERAPDFTNLVAPRSSRKYRHLNKGVALIPNAKSVKRGCPRQYAAFFAHAATRVQDAGLIPFILLHELDADREVAERIRAVSANSIEIVREPDPLLVKGIVRSCEFVVCSRFHGVINAFSQGVPAIGTSWSHKYGELFRDYDCEKYLVATEDCQELDERISELLDTDIRGRVSVGLESHSEKEKEKAQGMWVRVEELLYGLQGH